MFYLYARGPSLNICIICGSYEDCYSVSSTLLRNRCNFRPGDKYSFYVDGIKHTGVYPTSYVICYNDVVVNKWEVK